MDDRSPHLLQLFMENRHFGFVTKFPQKNTDDDHNSSIQKKKKQKQKRKISTQLNSTQSFTASSKGAILQHCCIGWLQNSWVCGEESSSSFSGHFVGTCVASIFVCWSGWVGCDFFPFFPSLFSLNSVWTENLGVDDNHVINRLLPICTMVQAQLLLPMRDPSIISCLYTSWPGAFFFNSQFREGRGWWWSSTRGMNQKFG